MVEFSRPDVFPVVRKPPVVEKVLYGIGKFIDNNTPMAHSDRILTAVNRYIIPKLKPEQMAWVRKHKDAIETASVVAGVGITATEITIATVFTVKMVKRFRHVLERIQASRPIRRTESVRQGPGRKTLEGMAGARPKGKSIVPEKEIPTLYDRTNELLIIQEMGRDPRWETHTSRALAEGKLVLRANERVDWARLGLPDPDAAVKKVKKLKKIKLHPSAPTVNSYAYKAIPPPDVVAPRRSGLADAIRDKIEEIWPWSFQNQELSARRKKFDAQKARNVKKAADIARAEQQKIWDAQRMQMIAKQEMNMELDYRKRLEDAIARGNAERLRQEALKNKIK